MNMKCCYRILINTEAQQEEEMMKKKYATIRRDMGITEKLCTLSNISSSQVFFFCFSKWSVEFFDSLFCQLTNYLLFNSFYYKWDSPQWSSKLNTKYSSKPVSGVPSALLLRLKVGRNGTVKASWEERESMWWTLWRSACNNCGSSSLGGRCLIKHHCILSGTVLEERRRKEKTNWL